MIRCSDMMKKWKKLFRERVSIVINFVESNKRWQTLTQFDTCENPVIISSLSDIEYITRQLCDHQIKELLKDR